MLDISPIRHVRPRRRSHGTTRFVGRPLARLGAVLLALVAGCDGAGPGGRTDSPAPPHSQLPGLSQRVDGAPLLSWVESRHGSHRLRYSVREDSAWSSPVTVAEGSDWFVNWADVPSVVPLTDALWAAHWLVKQPGGMYAYDIALSLSQDGGRTWGAPFRPHDDASPTEHGFVSLWPEASPDGATGVGVAWLDGRHLLHDPATDRGHDPRTTLRSRSFDAGGRPLAAGTVDDRVCDCCPTAVARTPSGPVLAYRDRTRDEVRDIRAARLDAAGWTPLGTVADDGWVIDGCPVNGPAIAARGASLGVAWYTEAAGTRRVRFTRRTPAGWTPPVDLAEGTPLGRVGLTWLDDTEAAVSWLNDVGDGQAELLVVRAGAAGHGRPLRVALTAATRPAGMPRLGRAADGLLLAWTQWQEGTPRVVTARVPVAALPACQPAPCGSPAD